MAAERSNGAPWGAPVRPIPPPGRPYSSIRGTGMCTKALRRGKLIGIVLGDEFTIALGDMGQKQQKTLLAVCSYSFKHLSDLIFLAQVDGQVLPDRTI